MRCFVLACALIVTACSREQAPVSPALAAGVFGGSGRDALCIVGEAGAQRAGFIVFGPGDSNCTAAGRLEPAGAGWQLTPGGDRDCRIPFIATAAGIRLGSATPACAYYCGPGANFAGKAFTKGSRAKPATDFAGDPLC